MSEENSVDPLDRIREAVLQAGRDRTDPSLVVALLLKIGSEISWTTRCLSREDWNHLTEGFWEASGREHAVRVALGVSSSGEA
jgi:hypothetical protein